MYRILSFHIAEDTFKGIVLTNPSIYSVRFPDSLVLLYSGYRLVAGCSVTEAILYYLKIKQSKRHSKT